MTLSTHDHGNCELCEYLDQERDALSARVAALAAALEGEHTKLRDFVVWWHKATPNKGLTGDSRVAFDAQTRALEQLLFYMEPGQNDSRDYISGSIECRKRAALDAAREG